MRGGVGVGGGGGSWAFRQRVLANPSPFLQSYGFHLSSSAAVSGFHLTIITGATLISRRTLVPVYFGSVFVIFRTQSSGAVSAKVEEDVLGWLPVPNSPYSLCGRRKVNSELELCGYCHAKHKAKDIVPSVAWRREAWGEEALDDLP